MRAVRPWLTALLVALAAPAGAEEDSIVAVIHAENSTERISEAELRHLFQGQRTHWPNHLRVRVVLPPDDSAVMRYVAATALRLGGADQVARFYLERVFLQRATDVPPQLSAEAALAYVARERGAIALLPVSATRRARGVKVVQISH